MENRKRKDGEDMKEPKITQAELMAALDSLRQDHTPDFTEEQYEYIHYARVKAPQVYWKDIMDFLKTHFDIDVKCTTLRNRYNDWLKNK